MTQRVEPLLIQRGLVQITNAGRRLTPDGLARAKELKRAE
jgi:Holliday junction resolvasome RuvABC ATP-dependent DNA helicase subunit